MNISEFKSNVIRWATIRGFDVSSPKTQYLSTIEEYNEIEESKQMLDVPLLMDSIGDVAVTLVILDLQLSSRIPERPFLGRAYFSGSLRELSWRVTRISGALRRERWDDAYEYVSDAFLSLKLFAEKEDLDFAECCEIAWNEIKDRRGMMIEGSYVKYEDFTDDQRIDFMNKESTCEA